jgi:protein tyrosine/serine phosphatase
MAGKDRTGIAVAMIQLAAGVHRDDVVADYLLTNTAGDVEARIAAGAGSIRAVSRQMGPEVLRVLMGVEAEYLDSAFAKIAEKHGSIEGYLRDVLESDDRTRDRLRDQIVEY